MTTFFNTHLNETDTEIFSAIECEYKRQENQIELIASENIVSRAVMDAQGSVMTNKYAEGYPKKRYYGGCECVDIAEEIAIKRVCELFSSKFANVQPHSGSQANQAVFTAVLKPGDSILGMDLNHGGHLTHGSSVNQSGKWFDAHFYMLDEETQTINYDKVLQTAKQVKPKLIIAGASAYPREIDFAKFKQIADEVGAYLMVDMAHIAGLVAVGEHMSPIPYADFVTSTTHKTLRGPRGGIVLTQNEELAKKVNSAIFPGIQGGPLMHVIAAKAVAFGEALTPQYKQYIKQVKLNANILAETLMAGGVNLVSNGTDNHLILADLRSLNITGKLASATLDDAGLTCNKNSVPFDDTSPFITSGIRLGTPAATSRGLKQAEFKQIGEWIVQILQALSRNDDNIEELQQLIHKEVLSMCNKFPIYNKVM